MLFWVSAEWQGGERLLTNWSIILILIIHYLTFIYYLQIDAFFPLKLFVVYLLLNRSNCGKNKAYLKPWRKACNELHLDLKKVKAINDIDNEKEEGFIALKNKIRLNQPIIDLGLDNHRIIVSNWMYRII